MSENGKFSLEAYAVNISRGIVHLMRITDRQIIQVNLKELSREDQAWIAKNTSSIRSNGPLVKKFISSNAN